MSSSEQNPSSAPPPTSESKADASTPVDYRARARQAAMRRALSNLSAGKLQTAAALLLELYQTHPGTPEGQEAGRVLSQLAEGHEAAGRHHLAADLYKKLAGE